MQHSESLLTEILLLLQTLNASVHEFQVKLKQLELDVGTLDAKFDEFLEMAMPGDLVEQHAQHHDKLTRPGPVKRLLLRMLKD